MAGGRFAVPENGKPAINQVMGPGAALGAKLVGRLIPCHPKCHKLGEHRGSQRGRHLLALDQETKSQVPATQWVIVGRTDASPLTGEASDLHPGTWRPQRSLQFPI